MINLFLKLFYSGIIASFFSTKLNDFIFKFESGTYSYYIFTLGISAILISVFYKKLSQLFATKVIIMSKEEFEKRMELELKRLEGENE